MPRGCDSAALNRAGSNLLLQELPEQRLAKSGRLVLLLWLWAGPRRCGYTPHCPQATRKHRGEVGLGSGHVGAGEKAGHRRLAAGLKTEESYHPA